MSPPTQINVSPDVTPNTAIEEQPTIGLIGMGAMGRLYADQFVAVGWKKIHVCDLPEKYDALQSQYADVAAVTVYRDGHGVARSSDFIIYSVEAEFVGRVVKQFGPSTKLNAVVAGQTSVKAPEKEAFEKYLPEDTHIISCHSLHGPTVSPIGQPLVIINHRSSPAALSLVLSILRPLRSRFVYLSYAEHDLVTANTQAVTHAAFLSMGTAWASTLSYPWEHGLYVGGIETAKVNLTLRIFSNAWHVYAGLAILNPAAKSQIECYARCATELFKLMIEGGRDGRGEEGRYKFRERVEWAGKKVFGGGEGPKGKGRVPILLSEEILDKFSLGKPPVILAGAQQNVSSSVTVTEPIASPTSESSSLAPSKYKPNSHLSLLAMVDCWAHLDINPYHHLSLAATPIFRLFLGVAEYLFHNKPLLESAVQSALEDTWHRSDDLEFVVAARGWSQCVSFESFDFYRRRFEQTRSFFEGRFGEATKLGSEMIKVVMESEIKREEELELGAVVAVAEEGEEKKEAGVVEN